MAGVILDAGLNALINGGVRVNSVAPSWSGAKLRLFKNNVTPGTATVLADLTEATFTGYAAAAIATTDWSAPGAAGYISSSLCGVKTFTITAGTQDIYGWYVTDSAGTSLMYAQRDSAPPISLDAAGVNQLSLILNMQLKDISTP